MTAFATGLARARARVSARFCLVVLVATSALSAAIAVLEREEGPTSAVDLVLSEAVFAWVIPLVAYYAVGRAAEKGRLDSAVLDLVRHGGNRRVVLSGFVTGIALRACAVLLPVSVLAVVVARGAPDAAALSDAFTTAWITALGAVAYTALFSLGALFGRAGQGRTVLLVVDWTFGALSTELSIPWPRAHLQCLIGGPFVSGLPVGGSIAMLCGIVAACVLAGAARVPA